MVAHEVGARVWYGGKEDGCWKIGEVIACAGGGKGDIVVRRSGDAGGQDEPMDSAEASDTVFAVNRGVEEDMTALHHIHEPAILENLRLRALEDAPYTFMGPILVSVNPLRELDESGYECGTARARGPFAIAEIALQQLQLGARSGTGDQSIVIGGESGAGKTESAKRVIRHVVARCHGSEQGNELEERLLQVSPVLEAIGNASTCMNHNSSRFGKYTKVILERRADNQGWCITGARIETYLLEKSRVVFQGPGERSFHILHYLRAAREKLPHLGLDALQPDASPRVGDKDRFDKLCGALATIGIDQDVLFASLAGVLHLLQVEFEGDADAATISSDAEGIERAVQNRNAVAKAIYAGAFEWVLQRLNQSLGGPQDDQGSETPRTPMHFIGVLDIFGFESMQQNSFEQLLINYTNEALQDTFIRQVFEAEVALYKAEGLVMKGADFPPPRASSECVHLFHGVKGKPGLLALVDEVSRAPQPSDEKLNKAMHDSFAGHTCFPRPHPKDIRTTFIVAHYPGPVSYVAEGFIHKNNDQLPERAQQVLSTATNVAVAWGRCSPADTARGPTNARAGAGSESGAGSRRRPRRKVQSIVSKFAVQIKALVETLEATKCSFIRCVKPNVQMQREEGRPWFDRALVVSQLRCLSIEQTAQVLKSGLPTRIPYQSLIDAYAETLPQEALRIWRNLGAGNAREFTKALFWAFDVPHKAYRCGTTRVFFRNGQLSMLDRILEASKVWSCAAPSDAKAQAERKYVIDRFKLYYVRMLWRKCVAKAMAAHHFESRLRYFRARNEAISTIQQRFRAHRVRCTFLLQKAAALEIQCCVRGWRARLEFAARLAEAAQLAQEEAARLAEAARAAKEEAARLEKEAALAEAEKEREKVAAREAEAAAQQVKAEQMLSLTERSRSWIRSPSCSRNSSFVGSIKPGGQGLEPELLAVHVREVTEEDVLPSSSRPQSTRLGSFRGLAKLEARVLQGNRESEQVQSPQETMSLEKCKRIARELFGENAKGVTMAMVEAFREQTYGPFADRVLASRLKSALRESEHERALLKEQKTRLHAQLEDAEQRCWEYKVVAAEREARITELTTRMLDLEADFRERERAFTTSVSKTPLRVPTAAGALSSDEAASLASLVSIIQSQQLQLAAQSDEISRLSRLQQDTQDAKEYMANVLDQLTLDLERERTQAKRNFDFFEQKLREADSELEARDVLIKGLERIVKRKSFPKQVQESLQTSSSSSLSLSSSSLDGSSTSAGVKLVAGPAISGGQAA
ncbi:Myosin-2 [Hondaea fermentalgiana]|uniref:Myosin-2 n=1 Tax=Hondaea fermentalgiana TaxID=2315210 RepID=A0A2R5G585_9STRA|nr:Myosin-2 [Hondaea fermentalgiana]|eukprot:GBG24948.1 Myosin-2 [Hondaea fermentalgiana]